MQAGERLDVVNVSGGSDATDRKAEAAKRLGCQYALADAAPVLPIASGGAAQAIGAREAGACRGETAKAGWRSAETRGRGSQPLHV